MNWTLPEFPNDWSPSSLRRIFDLSVEDSDECSKSITNMILEEYGMGNPPRIPIEIEIEFVLPYLVRKLPEVDPTDIRRALRDRRNRMKDFGKKFEKIEKFSLTIDSNIDYNLI